MVFEVLKIHNKSLRFSWMILVLAYFTYFKLIAYFIDDFVTQNNLLIPLMILFAFFIDDIVSRKKILDWSELKVKHIQMLDILI